MTSSSFFPHWKRKPFRPLSKRIFLINFVIRGYRKKDGENDVQRSINAVCVKRKKSEDPGICPIRGGDIQICNLKGSI